MKNELQRRSQVRHRINLVTYGANAVGAMLTLIYFSLMLSSRGIFLAEGRPTSALGWSIGVTIVLLGLGGTLGGRYAERIYRWYLHLAEPAEPAPLALQRRALNLPATSAAITFGMWALAGLTNALTFGASDWVIFSHNVLGVSALAGPVTGVLVYFAVERIWRPEIPIFFAQGSPVGVAAFRLTVRMRLLILFVMGSLPLLLLALSTHNQLNLILDASQSALFTNFVRLEVFIVGVGLLLAVTLGATLGASLVEPVEALGKQLAAVREGNLEVRAPITSNDEFGMLADGFNAMLDGLRQEEVIRRLFGRYVTPQVADYAIRHGAELGGQLVEATVMFTDIRGFTTMTEQLEPSALIALLNRYFQALSQVVNEHGGLVNKFGGDSLLAVFGTPLNPAEDHPARAVKTAQAILAALADFNREQARRGEPTLNIGMGLATGPVLAGNVGSAERLEYTVIGDTVNLASRLQTMTKELKATILLGESTAEAVQGWAPLAAIGQVEVRGKQAPVRVYALQTA